jgi:hypothetical protein
MHHTLFRARALEHFLVLALVATVRACPERTVVARIALSTVPSIAGGVLPACAVVLAPCLLNDRRSSVLDC